ncbi:alpha/beta fold hydrolase [Streptomyces sp. NPDC059651]|uniref:alpha/beta hydrolase family protein n=1 Tax=unclassified Streptomyces TaxID=2593676 RepID=UPI0036CF3E20
MKSLDEALPLLGIVRTDGAAIPLRGLVQSAPHAPVLLIAPAMGTPARFYRKFVKNLYRAGLTALTMEFRGQGECEPKFVRGVRYGYRELVEVDLPAVVRTAQGLFPDAPLFLTGHSLGGQLSLLHGASGRSPGLKGVAIVASGSGWYRSFGGTAALRILVRGQLALVISLCLGHWPGERLRFGGLQPTGLIREWTRQQRTGRYSVDRSAADYEALLAELRLPVFAASVEADPLAPPGSVDHLLDKVRNAPVVRWQFTEAEAQGAPLDHFRWVRCSMPLAQRLAAWTASVNGSEGKDEGEQRAY